MSKSHPLSEKKDIKRHMRLLEKLQRKVGQRLQKTASLGLPVWEADPSLPKLSALIEELVQPVLKPFDSPDAFKNNQSLINLVCACWNVAICPEEKEDELWERYITYYLDIFTNPAVLAKYMKKVIARKRAEHPHDHRFAVGFSLTDQHPDYDYYIQVAHLPLTYDEYIYYMEHSIPKKHLAETAC